MYRHLALLDLKYPNIIPLCIPFFLKSYEGKFLRTEKVVEYRETLDDRGSPRVVVSVGST